MDNDFCIKICTDNAEMHYLICQLKEIFNTLSASSICDADFVISQIRKKMFSLNPIMLQSLDDNNKKIFKEILNHTLDEAQASLNDFFNQGFESIKRHIFRKFETNYFADEGKEGICH